MCPRTLARPRTLLLMLALLAARAPAQQAPDEPATDDSAPASSALVLPVEGRLSACGAASLLDNPDPHPVDRCQVIGGVQPDPAPDRVSICRTNDHFGSVIVSGGDFDGDGRPDLAVAGLHRGEFEHGLSQVWVLPGEGGRPLAVLEGNPGDGFGAALAFVPDLDGDGRDELLVGAPTQGLVGRVYLVPGRPDLAGGRISARSEATLLLDGTVPGAHFGASLALADLTGDGELDLAVGAPGEEAEGDPGAVHLFPGLAGLLPDDGAPVLLSARHAQRSLTGREAGDRFGTALAALGNLDDLPGQELAVGAPATSGVTADRISAERAGTVAVYGWQLKQPLWRATGAPGSAFGFSLSSGHDANGDGLHDLLVGAPLASAGDDGGSRSPGAVLGALALLSGGDGSLLRGSLAMDDGALTGAGRFGSRVALCADLNGDGLPEMLASSPLGTSPAGGCTRHGEFHPQGGPMCGSVSVLDGASGKLLVQIVGETGRDRLGWSLHAADLNGDGMPEVFTGAAGWSPPGNNAPRTLLKEVGRAYRFDGSQLGGQ